MVAEKTTERIYDLLLKGGRVIDPANNVDGLFDVAIVGRFIALVDKDISSALSLRVADVTGLIVTPGLVDLHAHFYGYSAAVHPMHIACQKAPQLRLMWAGQDTSHSMISTKK